MDKPPDEQFQGTRVIITKGFYAGCEGVCLGRASSEKVFTVSPDGSHEIIELLFEEEFGLLIDLSTDPSRN